MVFMKPPAGTTLPLDQQPVAPPSPFVWGAGGARLTPAQVIAQQQQAAQLSRPNYSPVSSVWEGLGRVVDNVRGGYDMRTANTAAQELQTQNMSVAQALLGGDSSAIGAGYAAGGELADLAGKVYDTAHPKAKTPGEFEQRLLAGGIQPGTPQWQQMNLGAAQAIADPIVTLPGGGAALRSTVMAQLGGGDLASPVPTAPVGKLTPLNGGPMQPASGTFR